MTKVFVETAPASPGLLISGKISCVASGTEKRKKEKSFTIYHLHAKIALIIHLFFIIQNFKLRDGGKP